MLGPAERSKMAASHYLRQVARAKSVQTLSREEAIPRTRRSANTAPLFNKDDSAVAGRHRSGNENATATVTR